MKSGNPAFGKKFLKNITSVQGTSAMTIQGTINKTLLLFGLAVFSASWVWSNPMKFIPLIFPLSILCIVVAILTMFKKEWAGITSPIYALFEGMILGSISSLLERSYPGIVIQAVMLTFGTLFCLLMAYKTGIIKVTEKFKSGIIAGTGAIALIYIISFVVGMFGVRMPLVYGNGFVGIIFSLFVVVIAALNLVLDFDFIKKMEEYKVPKYMEWYGAFSIMLTLVWLYFEILRLLSKLRSR